MMYRLFTVKWPAFARIEALLVFVAIPAIYAKIPAIRPVVEGFASAEASKLGISAVALTWGAVAFLVAGPYLGAIIVVDRLLGVRNGFAWLSILAVAIWAGAGRAVRRRSGNLAAAGLDC